jgi:hypothetical protein
MLRLNEKYRRSVGPFFLLASLCFSLNLSSQVITGYDSVIHSNPDELIDPRTISPVPFSVPQIKIPGTPLPSGILTSDRTPTFYDSLRVKASRKLITRKLYDLLIVSREPYSRKEISGSSEAGYVMFSGKRIRKIEIRRLPVFGSSITIPLSSSPDKLEKLINATHINTSEHIIRKNLLFSEGDTLSPLLISDNERILRQLPYIDDSRIIAVPVSEEEVDIIVITKDIYSLGASYKYSSITKGAASVFEKNIFGMGHEFRINMSYDSGLHDSPGFGAEYNVDNIAKSFINLGLYYFDGLGKRTYGIGIERKLVSSTTKYAFGVSVRKMYTTEDLDTLPVPEPLKYNLQDYWFLRSIMLDRESVSRLILGARFTNNDVWNRPFILPESYHELQKYRMFLGSAAFTFQKYYKTNLIFGYGRTEDIPYGGLLNLTFGKEYSEFKERIYTGAELSLGQSIKGIGYFYTSLEAAAFFNDNQSEQGLLSMKTSFISNLFYLGRFRIRNFVKADYTRGFDRYYDENLTFTREDGFTGFRNDSVGGRQRLAVNLESVLFSPVNLYGFRFAFFGFADLGFLFGTNEFVQQGEVLSSIGAGLRIRNDNFVFNTLQIRLGYFPNLPDYSKVNYVLVSGEQLLRPDNFDPGPPSLLPYK